MDIYIPVSVAPDAKLSLLDASCELVNNGTHYIGHVMYNTCGTTVSSFSDHLQVHNQITVHTSLDVSAPVVFDELKIVLDCRVQLEQQLNGAFQSVTVAPIHEVDDNEANFLLKEFSGPDYRQEITRYPVQVPATGELFLEVSLASPQDDTGVRIVQCWATPTSSADDSTRFSLIRDGCPASRAVHPQPSPGVGQVRFSVQAFHFPGSNSHDVTAYLHCDVSTCRGNTCNVNCDVTTRKRRRSLRSHSTLTYGPVFVK
ncbi:ZP domain-containing protein-like [Physella acuta]|uniref:ZP domain-containing protein-like n=1 Tax=Physella acuta TaxID=109671 RepID=UPI0027DDD8A5|nr:ZP domain-containing protein-like [Physella acuta]